MKFNDWRSKPPIKLAKPIESQTPEQEAAMMKLRQRYRDWSYGSADNLQAPIAEIRGAILDVLRLVGVKERQIIVVDGPLLAQMAANVLKAKTGDNLGGNLWGNLRDNLWGNLWGNLRDNLRDNLGDNLWGNLRDNLGDNLWGNLRDNLRDNLRGAKLEFEPMDWFGSSGQWWIAYYDHIANTLMRGKVPDDLLEAISKVRRLFEVGVSGALTFENAIIVWRRPVYAKYDEQNRAHAESGPQVLWQDGFKQYNWHGVNMMSHAEAIENPAGINAKSALAEPNVEVRRAIVEIMGMQRFLADAEATVLDEVHESNTSGEQTTCRLLRLRVDGGAADLAVTEVVCPSTGKVIHEEVPIEVAERKSYKAARAWQFGAPESVQSESIWET